MPDDVKSSKIFLYFLQMAAKCNSMLIYGVNYEKEYQLDHEHMNRKGA
jgi:hypothetical protein